MNKEVHAAALRAAAKVAFSVAFITGCSSEEAASDTAPGPQESEVRSNACGDKKFTCTDLVKASFPAEGNYPGQAVASISPAVKQCCTELLIKNGSQTEHRWDCCANRNNAGASEQNVNIACTPWGPPVPPAMKRVRDVFAEVA
jgi:hypothetical protein